MVHIEKPGTDPAASWCGKAGVAVSIDKALAEHVGETCYLCVLSMSRALHGPEMPIDPEIHAVLYGLIIRAADEIIARERPTHKVMLNLTVTIMAALAQVLLRYPLPADRRELPLDDRTLPKLAHWTYLRAMQERDRQKN